MEILTAAANPFRGMVITTEALPASAAQFQTLLNNSLTLWRSEGYRVAWLQLPRSKAALVPIAVEAGFVFHHSSDGSHHDDNNYVMLICRLEEGAFVPAYASHYIGVGGVVLNNLQELLVVSEQHRRDKSRPFYKLPGGALHAGEHIVDGVIREVLEETGVQAKFESVACFRHWHGYRYGKSDIYIVCRLSALSLEISKQDDEIEECRWMAIEEYLHSDAVAEFNKRIVQAALENSGISPTSIEGYADPEKR